MYIRFIDLADRTQHIIRGDRDTIYSLKNNKCSVLNYGRSLLSTIQAGDLVLLDTKWYTVRCKHDTRYTRGAIKILKRSQYYIVKNNVDVSISKISRDITMLQTEDTCGGIVSLAMKSKCGIWRIK